MLIEQNVERLFVNASLGEFDFGVLLVGGVDDGCATHFGNLLAVAKEAPQANLLRPNDILEEQHSTTKAQRQFVEQLQVL